MKLLNKYILLCISIYIFFGCKTQQSKLWKNFVEASNNNSKFSLLSDFSYAGYDFGESELPKTYDLQEFKVEDFGAIANDELSDRKAVVKAISAAEKAGGGIVVFNKGTYRINEERGLRKSIVVSGNNIILKGAGHDEGGTVLLMKEALEPTDPNKLWTTPALIHFKGKSKRQSIGHLAAPVKAGDFEMVLKESHNLKKGDIVEIFAEGIFLNEQFLKGKKTRNKWTNINETGVYAIELHQVARVSGKKITFRAPILIDMAVGEPWQIMKMDLLENCGFENIRFVGNFHEPFIHHKNAYHDGGFKAINMTGTFNSWVRYCSFVNVSDAVSMNGSLCGTIYKNYVLGNGGHSSFGLSRSTRGLIAYCFDQANQWHGPNASHGSVGSVILRFNGNNRGIDLHGEFPRVTLFDDCVMAGFDGDYVGRASHGGNFTNLPNHLDGLVFWNFKQTALPRPNFDFWDLMEDRPDENYGPLTAVDPVLVGYQGKGTSFVKKNVGVIESFGKAVTPLSLYLAQLKLRVKKVPDYLKR